MRKLPVVLSATALAVSLLGATPLGAAAMKAVPLALFANNADRVDGIHASKIPHPGYLVPLGPTDTIPVPDASTGRMRVPRRVPRRSGGVRMVTTPLRRS